MDHRDQCVLLVTDSCVVLQTSVRDNSELNSRQYVVFRCMRIMLSNAMHMLKSSAKCDSAIVNVIDNRIDNSNDR